MAFEPGDQCCSGGLDDPNSFVANGSGALLTLWGANRYNSTRGKYDTGNTVGMDFGLQLSQQVPEPAKHDSTEHGIIGIGFKTPPGFNLIYPLFNSYKKPTFRLVLYG